MAAVLVIGAGAAFQSRVERQVLGRWLTAATWPWRAVGGAFQSPRALIATLVLLVAAWGLSGWRVLRRPAHLQGRAATGLLLAPALPFALSPPFMSKDAYAYLAQGQLLLHGGSPYHEGVKALGPSTVVRAVDPMWRGTTSPYGPLALRLDEALMWIAGERELLALVLLRVVVVACAAVSVVAVRRLAPPAWRSRATWLAASPLTLVHVIAPLHLEALITALLLAALVVHSAGRERAAGALAVAAGEVKVTALVVLLCLVVHAARSTDRHAVRRLLSGASVAAAGGALLLASDPLGWVRGLSTPGAGWAPYTPASAVVSAVDEALDALSVSSARALLPLARAGCALIGAVVLFVLLRRRSTDPALTAGRASLVTSLAAPVLWPWYLSPAALLLAPGRSWRLSATLGASGVFLALPLKTSYAERVGAVAALGCVLLSAALLRTPRGRA